MESHPPFENTYGYLFDDEAVIINDCQLPLVDLAQLKSGGMKRQECMRQIGKASSEWGSFQVVNHGISQDLLKRMRGEQHKVFNQPFEKKTNGKLSGFSSNGTYRWGAPSATNLQHFSWTEAFHIPLNNNTAGSGNANSTLNQTIEEYAKEVSDLAQQLAQLLAENALSNDVYKSVGHRVMANKQKERFSVAFFLCPSHDRVIGSCREPSCREPAVYRKFSFGEFRQQVQDDVRNTGHKIGLPKFLKFEII